MARSSLEDSFRGKQALITGGLGFIGSALAHRLVGMGAQVAIVDALIPDCGGNLFNINDIADQVVVEIADIGDGEKMAPLVREQEYIFNLAGQVSHVDSMRNPMADLEINAKAHLAFLETCRRHNPEARLVYAGTRQVYGRPVYLPVDESHPLSPTDVNGVNKQAGEWYHMVYHAAYGLRATSLRLTNVYGPRQLMKHSRQGFIPWFIRLAMDGEEIQVFGDGRQRRDLTYVDDVVEAFLLAAASDAADGQVFNLGGLQAVSLAELAGRIVAAAGSGSYRLVPFPAERKAIDIGDFYADYSKIEQTLGWEPRVPLEEGLTRTMAYYRCHKERYW